MKPHSHTIETAITLLSLSLAALPSNAIEQWGVEEITLHGPRGGNPYLDVQLSARFIRGGRTHLVPGFWDGENIYRIRFSPPTKGKWRYETVSPEGHRAGDGSGLSVHTTGL